MLPVATWGNTSADAQPDDDLERLARLVTQLEEQCRWLRRLAVVAANGVERVLIAAPLSPAGEG